MTGPVEWVDDEREDVIDTAHRPGPRPPRWAVIGAVAAAVVALLVVAITWNDSGSGTQTAAAPTHRRSSVGAVTPSPSAVITAGSSPGRGAFPPPVVTKVGHRLLGVRGGWELFGRGLDVVVRIQFASGRITRTVMPQPNSGGPVSFLATGDAAIVRPLDFVPGYVVADGRRARPATRALSHGGVVLPGPRPGEMWAQVTRNRVMLVDVHGRPVSPLTTIRTPSEGFPASDGAGYLLVYHRGTTFDARPDGRTPIPQGRMLATGPTRWLVTECHGHRHCAMTVVDRRTGARRTVPGHPALVVGSAGSISPDGSVAALVTDRERIDLLDLRSGALIAVPVTVDTEHVTDPASQFVWSSDSRWLFALWAGRLFAVSSTGHVASLGVPLPYLLQLAVRPA